MIRRAEFADQRAVAEAMLSYGVTDWISSREPVQIAAHTFNRTHNGRGASFGVERTRRCLRELQTEGYVRRRRSWGTLYSYWLTEKGIEWLRPKS